MITILCINGFFFLLWVIYLKVENNRLRKENRILRDLASYSVHMKNGNVDIVTGARSHGNRPRWLARVG